MEGKAEKTFKNLGRKLDEMIKDLDDLKDNLKNKYGDRWEEISRNKERVEEEFSQFKEKHRDRFEEAERNLEKAGREIKNAFENIFAKKPKSNSEANPSSSGEPSNSSPSGDSSEH